MSDPPDLCTPAQVVLGQHDLLVYPKDPSLLARRHATKVFLHPNFTNVFR